MSSHQNFREQGPSEGAVAAAIAATANAISENQRQLPRHSPDSTSATISSPAQNQFKDERILDDRPISPLLPDHLDSPPQTHGNVDLESTQPHHQVSPMATPRRVGNVADRSSNVPSDNFEEWEASIRDLKTIKPAPAYVSASGATQAINDQSLDWGMSNKKDVQFSDAAILAINSFLDYTLRRLLAYDGPVNLSILRAAAVAVLRPKLGNAAIAHADEELHELLAENEDEGEDMKTQSEAQDQDGNLDVDLLWRRTRLRVMVYMRLGDMEDEDEERYVKEEQLLKGEQRRFSQATGLVSWSAAIYLTSLLEFIAEQILKIAAQSAVHRTTRSQQDLGEIGTASIEVLKVDMEKIALTSILGRTWRIWRRSLYTPRELDLDDDETENDSEEHLTAGSLDPAHSKTNANLSTAKDRDNLFSHQAKTVLNGAAIRRNSLGSRDHSVRMADSSTSKGTQDPASRPTLTRQRSSSLPTPERVASPFEYSYALPGVFPDDEHLSGVTDVGQASAKDERPSTSRSARTAELLARGTNEDIAELDSRKTLLGMKTLLPPKASESGHPNPGSIFESPGLINRNSAEALEAVEDATRTGEANTKKKRAHISGNTFPIDPADDPFLERDTSGTDRDHEANSALRFTDTEEVNDSEPVLSTLPEAVTASSLGRHSLDIGTTVLTSASIRGLEDFDTFGHAHGMATEPIPQQNIGPVAAIPLSPAELPSSRSRPVSPEQHRGDLDSSYSRGRTSRGVSSRAGYIAQADQKVDSRRSRSVPRPASRNLSAHRRSGLMAREPRVQTESTRGLAEFLRTTGPNKGQESPPLLLATSKSVSSLREWRNSYPNGARPSSADRPKVKAERDSKMAIPVASASTARPRTRTQMEPRSPRADTARNSELIDFIRTGPAIEGQHRISRAVAPFRSTMDSDQLQEYGATISALRSAKEVPTDPFHDDQRRSMSLPHVHDVSNLGRTVQPAHSGQPQRLSNKVATQSALEKKRARNKDPYAKYYMDDDDNNVMLDDDSMTAIPPSNSREESLAEFLRNSSPPRDNGIARARAVANGPHLDTAGAGRAGIARTARPDGSSRAERNELIEFLNAGPPTDSAPSPGIGSNHYSNAKENRKSRNESGKRSSSRRSGFFSWMK